MPVFTAPQPSAASLSATVNYSTAIPTASAWTQITISGISIPAGKAEIGFNVQGAAGQYIYIDGCELFFALIDLKCLIFACRVATLAESEGAVFGATIQTLATAEPHKSLVAWDNEIVRVNEAEATEPTETSSYPGALEKQTALSRALFANTVS